MCTRDCYRLFGYFLGFLWMASSVYYTTETIELLKLMKLRCDKIPTRALDTPDVGPARLQFSDAMIGKVCDFYTHLDVFMPYHIITTIIKMMPGILLVTGIYTSNITLVQVFALYGILEECFFVIVFSKIFAVLQSFDLSIWIYWIIVIFCVKLFFSIWILLGVYAAIKPRTATRNAPRV
ncbi:uncharacterized protein LOC126565145 [Anopheles maculipalpis]|uniref:uncharacterized protein LOC126565145 n=1 Tax=Anopheles maculipalpis TaxID=1496333 RepID=UPI002159591D|nr:uncharacterized protein LOC126565145 [Anopheles maculipalpis]